MENIRDTSISCTSTVSEYIMGSDWRIKANANSEYSNAGLVNNIAGKVIANYWLDNIYDKDIADLHKQGFVHVHDLDCLTGYCSGWSLRELLNDGFNGVLTRVTSRPAHHLDVALGQMANFMGILQAEWAGAQAFSSFDTYLAPYVFLDDLSIDQVKHYITQFVYALNVPSRWGQSPFTNITFDWVVPNDLKYAPPLINNEHIFKRNQDNFDEKSSEMLERAKLRDPSIEKLTDMKYVHFQKEMDMLAISFYQVLSEGDADGKIFTFPIPTVNITEDFDWDSEKSTELFKNTAKFGCSYFQNFIGSQYYTDEHGNKVRDPKAYSPGDIRSMCCRLQLDLKELKKRGNGLFGSAELTGSIGVVTINMARLGYIYKNDMESLIKKLDQILECSKKSLIDKRKFVTECYKNGLYPYTKRYLTSFHNYFSTIGVNGMNEMVRNFTNDSHDISSRTGIIMSKMILSHIREKMKEFQAETKIMFNLEATPGEGTCYRFAKVDKKEFGDDIIQAGFGENIYYTNSSQLPVNFTEDPFVALSLQDELQCMYTGGTVFHLYMREAIPDHESCKQLVKTIISNYRMPYITITPVFSICPKHGYIPGEHEFCPACDEELLKRKDDIINNTKK